MRLLPLFTLLLLAGSFAYGQPLPDSLLSILRTARHDTSRVNACNSLARAYIQLRPDSGIMFAKQALGIISKNLVPAPGELSTQLRSTISKATLNTEYRFYVLKAPYVLNSLASLHGSKGEYSQARQYAIQSLEIQEIISEALPGKDARLTKKLLSVQGATLGTLGNIYTAQAEYPKALESFLKALKIDEQNNDYPSKALHLGNMGIIYDEQKEFAKALECYHEAMKIHRSLGDSGGVETCYGNMGVVYDDMGDLDKALEYYLLARDMQEQQGNRHYTGTIGNIGNVYKRKGDPARSLSYYMQALELDNAIGNRSMVAHHYANIGDAYRMMKKYPEAEEALIKSLQLGKEIQVIDVVMKAESTLSELYSETGRWDKAYAHYKSFVAARDSVFSEEKSMEMGRMEGRYESEKQLALAAKEHEKQLAVEQEKQARQRMISYTAAGGLCMVGVFAFVIFNRLRVTRRQKMTIEDQKIKVDEQNRRLGEAKNIIEEKNKDIVDSINYARRLQEAIFPSQKLMQEKLRNYFILYKPKDIVAGDFYWLEAMGDEVLFAVADCTGHGVPGALVSVVCSNALNRAVKEFGITEPGKILDKVTDLVIETFEKSGSEVRDGMDISLWSLNTGTLALRWAGANNGLWIIPGSSANIYLSPAMKAKDGLLELSPDKQPVGKHYTRESFTTNSIQLYKGDTVYLFTDGYADQFGGGKGKKFKYSQLKQLLLSVSRKPMEEQHDILDRTFDDWRGTLSQVDDVCVAGVRI